jgi:hypothetical protein
MRVVEQPAEPLAPLHPTVLIRRCRRALQQNVPSAARRVSRSTPFAVLHDQIRNALEGRVEVENLDDVGVPEFAIDLGLAAQLRDGNWIRQEIVPQDLIANCAGSRVCATWLTSPRPLRRRRGLRV